MSSAKQQLSNIKHGGGIVGPNVCTLTFGPPCIVYTYQDKYLTNLERFDEHVQHFSFPVKY